MTEKTCLICGEKHYAKGLCEKHYRKEHNKLPEVKARMKETKIKYLERPEVKARIKEYRREYWKRPEVKEKNKERRNNRPTEPMIKKFSKILPRETAEAFVLDGEVLNNRLKELMKEVAK